MSVPQTSPESNTRWNVLVKNFFMPNLDKQQKHIKEHTGTISQTQDWQHSN